MPFQFYCPQGHLLEGHESQMGQQSQCPLCGAVFLIPQVPQPQAAAAAAAPPPPALEPAPAPPPAASAPPLPSAPAPSAPAPALEPRVVRIPCPKGHLLETPSDMFGQQALCPYCNTQFELLYENSVEYGEDQVLAKQRREEEINQAWVKWTIRAAIFVGVMFLGMFLYAMFIKDWLFPPLGLPTDAATQSTPAESTTSGMPAEAPPSTPTEEKK